MTAGRPPKTFTDLQIRTAINMYDDKCSSAIIGEYLGCSANVALNLLRDNGVKTRGRGAPPGPHLASLPQIQTIHTMRKAGHTLQHIGDHIGRSKQAVHQLLAAYPIGD